MSEERGEQSDGAQLLGDTSREPGQVKRIEESQASSARQKYRFRVSPLRRNIEGKHSHTNRDMQTKGRLRKLSLPESVWAGRPG